MSSIEPSEPPLPPFPLELLDLPDEQLALGARVWWYAYLLQFVDISIGGVPLDRIDQVAPELLEAIFSEAIKLLHPKTLAQDTDDESLAGFEKAIRLMEPDSQGNASRDSLIRAGGMIRRFFARQKLFAAALDEAATGRRRHSAAASKPRPGRRHYLQDVLREIATANPGIKWAGAFNELSRRAELPRDPDKPHIEQVCEVEGVAWLEPGKVAQDPLPMKKVKALFYKEADAVRKLRKKAESR